METIASFFKDTGLTPKINIRGVDGTVYVNNQNMTEVGGGRYKYSFSTYDPNKKYLIDTVSGTNVQSNINLLDGYDNKNLYFGPRGGTIVYGLKEEQIESTIDKILSNISIPGVDYTPLIDKLESLREYIAGIKPTQVTIPKQEKINYDKILNGLDSIILKHNIKQELVNPVVIEEQKKPSDEELLDGLNTLLNEISNDLDEYLK